MKKLFAHVLATLITVAVFFVIGVGKLRRKKDRKT